MQHYDIFWSPSFKTVKYISIIWKIKVILGIMFIFRLQGSSYAIINIYINEEFKIFIHYFLEIKKYLKLDIAKSFNILDIYNGEIKFKWV